MLGGKTDPYNTLATLPSLQFNMPKPRLLKRFQLINGGRSHYLDFLRNLTPQGFLFSFLLLLAMKLDFMRFDLENSDLTLVFFVIVAAFAVSVFSNSTLFYERCFSDWSNWLSIKQKMIRLEGGGRLLRFNKILKSVWRERFVEFIEISISIFFLQIALILVIATGMQSFAKILQANSAPNHSVESAHPQAARVLSIRRFVASATPPPSVGKTKMDNYVDASSLISSISALAAVASAIYACLQVKQSKESSRQAQKTLLEAFTQNKINALIALKDYFEDELPRINKLAEHFSTPETYESIGKPLYDEYEEVRKKLQRVNAEINKFYEFYVPTKDTSRNGSQVNPRNPMILKNGED